MVKTIGMAYQSGNVPVKFLRMDVETGAQTLWKKLAAANRTLSRITEIRAGGGLSEFSRFAFL
jgi:hypothetical protein